MHAGSFGDGDLTCIPPFSSSAGQFVLQGKFDGAVWASLVLTVVAARPHTGDESFIVYLC
jgi:hypothetical protein